MEQAYEMFKDEYLFKNEINLMKHDLKLCYAQAKEEGSKLKNAKLKAGNIILFNKNMFKKFSYLCFVSSKTFCVF